MTIDNKKTESVNTRRQFLKLSSAVALASAGSALLPNMALANDKGNFQDFYDAYHRNNEYFWHKIRREFVLNKRTTYMNVGTSGSIPERVIKQYHKNNERISRNPWDSKIPTINLAKEVAKSFGANENELILSRNTSDGISSILHGLQFEPGDVIITTNHEHGAMAVPLMTIAQRHQVQVILVKLPVFNGDNPINESDFVNAFNETVEEFQGRIRLIAFSHITYTTGTRLPVKRICEEVAIPNGIPTLIDGAHAPGMLNLNLHKLNCDFYAGAGHKWQCGPGATGILYIRDNAARLREFWSDRPNPLWVVNSSAMSTDLQTRFQLVGQDNYPAKQALVDCCNMWDTIGRRKIQNRILHLSKLCKKLINSHFPDNQVFSPNIKSLSSGLTTFNPFDDVHNLELLTLFRDRLHDEYGYIVRTTSFITDMDDDIKYHPEKIITIDNSMKTHALRISTHLFHSEEDVYGLITAMKNTYDDLM